MDLNALNVYADIKINIPITTIANTIFLIDSYSSIFFECPIVD